MYDLTIFCNFHEIIQCKTGACFLTLQFRLIGTIFEYLRPSFNLIDIRNPNYNAV